MVNTSFIDEAERQCIISFGVVVDATDRTILKQRAARIEDLRHQDLDLSEGKLCRKLRLCQVVPRDEHLCDFSYVLLKWNEL